MLGEFLEIVVMGEDCKVHVGSLSYSTDEDSLRQFFEKVIQVDVADGK